MKRMKIIGLVLLCLAAMAAPAQTNQSWRVCRNPVRVFKGQATVDLTLLFQWWASQPQVATNRHADANADTDASAESDRPLSAWARVTGTKISTIGDSWVLDAAIYTSPTVHTNARIILNHPPAVEEQTYETLKEEVAEAGREIAEAQRVYGANTNAQAKALKSFQAYSHSPSKHRLDAERDYAALAAQDQAAAAAALSQINQLEAARVDLEQQLKTIPAINGVYQVDWFAVLRGRSKQGVPIYDLGLVSASPP